MSTSSTAEKGGADLPPTELLYYTYDGNFQLECDAKVLSCQFVEDPPSSSSCNAEEDKKDDDVASRTVSLCLDRTVLHAQGGGQPTDLGTISSLCENCPGVKINISKVLVDRATGIVTHTGTLVGKSGDDNNDDDNNNLPFQPGDSVHISVDEDNRGILSECQTSGHVVDAAMARVGSVLPPIKGYHFLDGPYVEYKGKIPDAERQPLLEKLQAAFQEIVDEDIETQIAVLPKPEAEEVCNRVAENFVNLDGFTNDEPVRIVTVAGWPCPCGGTHVKSTGVLKNRQWGITGFRNKKGVLRVRYGQNWNDNK